MKTAHTSRMTSIRATLIFFVALVVGALALLSLGTRPAESQQASSQPLYTVHDLGTLAGGSISYAFGINDAGKVVGYSSPSGNATYHPFLYSDGQMSDLGTLGGTFGIAYGINDADKVVGSVTTSDNPGNMEQHAFLYSDGQMSDLSTLGRSTDYSAATAINNADQMIGQSTMSSDDHQGYNDQEYPFLYSDGMMRDLNSLIPEDSGWVITNVSDINDYGHIVGKGIHEDGREHAILLTPFSGFY
jgi:probable HAF family extracellular repeat protein